MNFFSFGKEKDVDNVNVPINVRSEIAPLKKVLLHRPGAELLNLTPDTLSRLLFDDIPFLPEAQKEHDEFAGILRDNGIEVVYLEDLMAVYIVPLTWLQYNPRLITLLMAHIQNANFHLRGY